ncbi:hypothetical protein AA0114_g12966 [Alternaria tenuissima]|uniref:Protein kinase domain-containing protein n=4 Tax=Alternaria alternata complex TaxID=187734 RepID=A0A4Q4QQD4_9PLEO|nr:hypothetical protein AA0115_g13050 [Alternaria tenuissima]RYN20538.1 hypothetical protein AA0114_g12966 [Alternaria tenuissima]RYO45156.1 hypothetical protein AA0116_g13390 [Alternaria tenuissima]
MAKESPDYKVLYLQEQRRREDEGRKREAAENAQKEAEAARDEEQRRREEAEQAQERVTEKTRKTALPEFLDACHNHLHSGLTVQTDPTLSTQGNPANANNKLRPERVVLWTDFPARQATSWNDLMESGFASERHFTSLHTLEETGEAVRRRMMSSELDLNLFQRHTVEDQVSLIIQGMHSDPRLRRKFGLQGSVNFENHANTLSPESQLEEDMEQLTVSGTGRRRSPRLQAKAKETRPSGSTDAAEAEDAGRKSTASSSRPRADQFCVYNTGTTRSAQDHIAAFILEYKAPHKLPLGYIYEGLGEMELDEVVQCRDDETLRDRFRRLVAAVITQAFSYMVRIGVEYGCVCTGEAYIFLRVGDDPRTVHYFLSVPKGDVGETTGWTAGSEGANRLHLTAVGQMLAFTLQALKTPPRSQRWRTKAAAQLHSWEVVYDELLDAIPEGTTQSSEYQPPEDNSFLRMSPVQLRGGRAKHSSPSCRQAEQRHEASDDEPESEPDPDTPSRQLSLSQHFSRAQKTRASPSSGRERERRRGQGAEDDQYCTQECLRGLAEGGVLDRCCPNMRDHGDKYHQIDQSSFLDLMRRQLADDLDTDCSPVSMPGACGVLFRVRLRSHGYVVAAKCTPAYFAHRLRWEASIYERLQSIQGIHVPVHLGNIDLETPYFYEGIVDLVHMMFLSFGGHLISQHLTTENKELVSEQVRLSADAIHRLGVLHRDLMLRNILWNEETGHVMVIDFERAEIEQRTVLGAISVNRKRKKPAESLGKPGQRKPPACTLEIRRAMFELNGMAQSIRCG